MGFRNARVVIADELATGNPGDARVVISNTPGQRIAIYTDHADEILPGAIDAYVDALFAGMSLFGPELAGSSRPSIVLYNNLGEFESHIAIDAHFVEVSGQIQLTEPAVLDTTWAAPSAGLVAGWSDLVGSRVGVLRDAAGNVHIRGAVTGTAAAPVNLFQLDFTDQYPKQTMEFVQRATAGAGTQSSVEITNTGLVRVKTNLTQAQSRLALDLSYSAL